MRHDVLIHSGPEVALQNPFSRLQGSSVSGQRGTMRFLQDSVSHRWRGEQHHSVRFAGPAESSVQDSVVEKAVVLVQLAKTEIFSIVLRYRVGVQ